MLGGSSSKLTWQQKADLDWRLVGNLAAFATTGRINKTQVKLGKFKEVLEAGDISWYDDLVGGWTNPFENYYIVKMGSSSPIFGVKIKNVSNHQPKKNVSPIKHGEGYPHEKCKPWSWPWMEGLTGHGHLTMVIANPQYPSQGLILQEMSLLGWMSRDGFVRIHS